ncbi:MAG: rhodanese-like domain-containing protein [Lentisphaeraceae bacterium]|nr:rhodanese-like domain-containing protein [Lentisphaeraceae bacterium]
MLNKKEYIVIAVILLFPIIPSYFLSGSIILKSIEDLSDPFGRKIEDVDKGNVLWLDARTQQKFEEKHIPGAILVNSKDWEGSLARLFEVFEPGKTIIVYCNKGCSSSRSVASRLRSELGQENIYYLFGGMDSWFSSIAQ